MNQVRRVYVEPGTCSVVTRKLRRWFSENYQAQERKTFRPFIKKLFNSQPETVQSSCRVRLQLQRACVKERSV